MISTTELRSKLREKRKDIVTNEDVSDNIEPDINNNNNNRKKIRNNEEPKPQQTDLIPQVYNDSQNELFPAEIWCLIVYYFDKIEQLSYAIKLAKTCRYLKDVMYNSVRVETTVDTSEIELDKPQPYRFNITCETMVLRFQHLEFLNIQSFTTKNMTLYISRSQPIYCADQNLFNIFEKFQSLEHLSLVGRGDECIHFLIQMHNKMREYIPESIVIASEKSEQHVLPITGYDTAYTNLLTKQPEEDTKHLCFPTIKYLSLYDESVLMLRNLNQPIRYLFPSLKGLSLAGTTVGIDTETISSFVGVPDLVEFVFKIPISPINTQQVLDIAAKIPGSSTKALSFCPKVGRQQVLKYGKFLEYWATNCTNLKTLSIRFSEIEEDYLVDGCHQHIKSFQKLETIDIESRSIWWESQESFAEFISLPFKKISLYLSDIRQGNQRRFSNISFKSLKTNNVLETLTLKFGLHFTKDMMIDLSICPNLKRLKIYKPLANVLDEDVFIEGWKSLQVLALVEPPIEFINSPRFRPPRGTLVLGLNSKVSNQMKCFCNAPMLHK